MASDEDTVFDSTREPQNNKNEESWGNDEKTVVDDRTFRNPTDDDTPVDNGSTPGDETPPEHATSGKDKKKSRIRYAVGLAGAAMAGAGVAYASETMRGDPSGPLTDLVEEAGEDPANDSANDHADVVPPWSDGRIAVATGDFDDMSYSEAFAAARSQVGAGGAFEWHGKVYGTYLHDEWHNMSDAEHAEFDSHFSWSKNFDPIDTNDNGEILATADDDADDEIVANVEEDANDEITVNIVENADGITVNIEGDSSEVEVLGVTADDNVDADLPVVSVDDNPIVMVDLDNDGSVDIIGSDIDGDGIIAGDELIGVDELFDINDNSIASNETDIIDSNDMDFDISI